AAALGPARAVVLVPIAVLLGAGEGFFLPGSFAIIPTLLPGDDLQPANALSSAGTQLATLAGPAMGGVLVAVFGASPAFALDAATFAISAATLAGVRFAQRGPVPDGATAAPEPELMAPETMAPEAAALPTAAPGLWRLLRSERILQIMMLVAIVANLGVGGSTEVALPALAHGPLHAGAGGYGGLLATFAAGALLGTLMAGQVSRLRRPAVAGSVAFLAETAFMAAVPYLGGALAAGAALAAFGFLNGIGNVVMITLFQRWAPPELLGRIMGMLLLASFGVFPVSVALGAVVVHDLGPAAFFPMGAAATALAVIVGLSQRSWRDLGAAAQPATDVTGRVGEPA
ncbi:MAG: MFS transporter, partial [Streptosporangiaceae bacterium]